MLKAMVHQAIRDVDPERWDALSDDPFSAHATLAALEGAGLPGVRVRYVVLRDAAGRWHAGAPLACVEVDAARLTHGLFRGFIHAARRVRPEFLHPKLMLCGTPLSVGNPPARVWSGADPAEVWPALAGSLAAAADEHGAAWRAFKEFGPSQRASAEAALAPRGWIVAPSETNLRLDIRWGSFAQYLADLRSPYRHRLSKSSRALLAAGVEVDEVPLAAGFDPHIHRLYEAVVDRAAVQLERLTPEFFVAFGRAHGQAARLLRFRREGQVIGWVALLESNGTLYDMFHGIDYAASRECALYFNQLASVVRLAIERRATRLSLGQSTDDAKVRCGAAAEPRWIALRHRAPAVRALLAAGRRRLFPEPVSPRRRVFAARGDREEGSTRCATSSW